MNIQAEFFCMAQEDLTIKATSREEYEVLLSDLVINARLANIPEVRVYSPSPNCCSSAMDGDCSLWEIHSALLFTERDDFLHFCWFLNPYHGPYVMDLRISGENWTPIKEWDPNAELIVLAHQGTTNVIPYEHARSL
jgi:hypothetical protein